MNGSLRANRPEEALHTIYMAGGIISPRFPEDLKGLFDLDGKSQLYGSVDTDTENRPDLLADILQVLLADYGLTAGISDVRDANLNKFMQFCGVRYQLVVILFPFILCFLVIPDLHTLLLLSHTGQIRRPQIQYK